MSDMKIDAIKALNGKIFAMLDDGDVQTFNFHRQRGRKFGVSVSLVSAAPPEEVVRTRSHQECDEIMRRANSTVAVTVENRSSNRR